MRFFEEDDDAPVRPRFPESATPSSSKMPATSKERYRQRLNTFKRRGEPWPRVRHQFFWLVHNCVAHPFMAFWPNSKSVEFHQISSAWLNDKWYSTIGEVPKIQRTGWWIFHNLVAHMAIGLLPIGPMFKLHDWSAEKMAVKGWI